MIKVLEKSVADKIAAGEVVERPLSIVKELVENSLDSGASSIIVEIKKGGKEYIRVTDDGKGIPREEVEIAFLRHATSKIEKAIDLNEILTLGFRGEALASIAAVTRTELVSKTKDSKIGQRLIIHGGETVSNIATGCPDGTSVTVEDLFYNTPARLKFLKSDGAESSKVIEFVSEMALAYSNVRFRLINNGNIVFSSNGDGNGLNTILSVYKENAFKDLIPIDYTLKDNHVYGFISKPNLVRNTRKYQVFFVNGRVIDSKVIEKGIKEGYRERLFPGEFPAAFIFIETSPKGLDVNIHPNKRSVRFDREDDIVALVAQSIKIALSTKEAVIQPTKLKSFEKEDSSLSRKEKGEQVDIKTILSNKRQESDKGFQIIEPAPKVEEEVTSIGEKGKPSIFIEEPSFKPFDFEELTITGSIFGTYITATDADSFYLIDQHAAHERVFYEKLVGEYLREEKLSQPILTPILIDVPISVKAQEYDWLDSLLDMGFKIESFGENSYIIRELPTFMTLSEGEDFVRKYIDAFQENEKILNTTIINKLITKSCKSAVKAHDYLSIEEMKALIESLKKCKNPFSCPHGRPTFIKFSQYEIEKMFKRV